MSSILFVDFGLSWDLRGKATTAEEVFHLEETLLKL